MHTEYLYIGSGVIIVLLLLLLAQSYIRRNKRNTNPHGRYEIMVDTPKGLIKSNNEQTTLELEIIRDKLLNTKHLATDRCNKLTYLISESMKNLVNFIQENPKMNSEALCKLELRSSIVNQIMENTIEPGLEWESEYKTLLDWEETERRMVSNTSDRLTFLVKNLDIVIAMMRSDVCDYGRINLMTLNKNSCLKNDISTRYDETTRRYTVPMRPTNEKLFANIVPTYSRENTNREAPNREAFASVNDTSFGDIGSKTPINSRQINSNLTAAYEEVYGNRELLKKRSALALNELEINDNVNNYSELIGQVSVLNRASNDWFNKAGSTLMDNSLEGQSERDILGYRPPGHIISQLYDPSDHYTINVNSCMGKTVPDEILSAQCTQYDIRPMMALQGEAGGMIANLQDSMHV
jgi:hypothetical protein